MTDIERPVLDPAVYEALWMYSNDLVSIVGADGTLRYASPSYARTLGYEPEELVGTTIFDRIHPDDSERLRASFALVRENGTATARFRYRHKDGSWRVLEVTGGNHIDDPVVQGVVVNGRDITEQVDAEDQIRRQEARYRRMVEATLDSMVVSDLEGRILEANEIAHELYGYEPGELIGRNLIDLIHPDWIERIADDLKDLSTGRTAIFTGVCRRKDGSRVWIEGRAAMEDDGDTPRVLSMARDITERVRSFELLEQRVEERTRELSTLLDVSRTVASTLELEPLLSLVLDALQKLVGYDGASISVIDGDDLVIVAGRPSHGEERPETRRVPVEERSAIWRLVARRGALIINDVHGDEPLAQTYREAAATIGYSDFEGFHSWMGVPLLLKERVVGVLSLIHQQPCTFSTHHAELLSGMTQQVAVAVENVQLYTRAQEAAILEERQRLSRELHDSVSQALYSVALGTKTARALVERDPAGAIKPLEFTLAQAERGLAEMRALIFELRPESLEQEGLVAALQRQVAALEARHQISINLSTSEEPDAPLAVKEALYRIAQEALNNTLKHAGATSVGVVLRYTKDEVVLEVQDNGKGFDPASSFPGHLGLQSMQERAARLQGRLDLESAPGAGTTVRATLPRHTETADPASEW